jgi:S-DNA-T family DNA segregation ATPase FtsK/SpoIIIE
MTQEELQNLSPAARAELEQKTTIAALQMKMMELGLSVKPVLPVSVGPLISIYRFIPEGSTKVSQVEALAEDFSVVLGKEIFVKRMPGESSISFAIPNDVRGEVKWLSTATEVWKYWQKATILKDPLNANVSLVTRRPVHIPIPLGFGVDYLGRPFIEDLTQIPHLLIAGTTGSGKSTLVKSLIASIVYTVNSSTIQLVLSDTKGVEFTGFAGLPHLLFPIATSVFDTLKQMDFLVEETKRRLDLFRGHGSHATNIHEYNAVDDEQQRLTLITMIIDETADIMDMGKIADEKLDKIVRKSRAAGIHVIACTQRPDAKMIGGTIKANFPGRLSFRLPSQIDSRVILGDTGAEHLMMRGDMLYKSPNRPGLHRLHAPKAEQADIQAAVEQAIHKE